MQAKPVGSPSAIPLIACKLLLIGQLIGSPASSTALALVVVRRHLPNRTRTQFCGLATTLLKVEENNDTIQLFARSYAKYSPI